MTPVPRGAADEHELAQSPGRTCDRTAATKQRVDQVTKYLGAYTTTKQAFPNHRIVVVPSGVTIDVITP